MIELTRLNGSPMVLNSDLIKTAEASPDTMLTLITGEKLIVREEVAEVIERVLAYRARLLATVARQSPHLAGMERLAGVASLDPTAPPAPLNPASSEVQQRR
ncbi:MAG: flagellar FlbD family protein [Acidobacteriota bacterium]